MSKVMAEDLHLLVIGMDFQMFSELHIDSIAYVHFSPNPSNYLVESGNV
jgi:hypothetical protein